MSAAGEDLWRICDLVHGDESNPESACGAGFLSFVAPRDPLHAFEVDLPKDTVVLHPERIVADVKGDPLRARIALLIFDIVRVLDEFVA